MAVEDQTSATNTAPITVKGVCLDDAQRVLLCRNHRAEWELPGGRPQVGESFTACLTREIEEETSSAATVCALVCAYPYEVLAGRWVNVIVYGCRIAQLAAPVASDEHTGTTFVGRQRLAEIAIADGYREAIELWHGPPETAG
jgi:8-oxo-dGTP pyrophosphatase MutT (NUDIX family)